MKIAILVAGLPPEVLGGAETQATRTAALLSAHHEISVFTRTVTVPELLRGRRQCQVIQRSPVRRRRLRFVADLVFALLRLRRHRSEIEVIVAYQTVIDGLIAVLAGRLWAIPVLVWVRSEAEFRPDASIQSRFLSPWVFRHADRIAVQTESLQEQFRQSLCAHRGPEFAARLMAKLTVIPNGVELDQAIGAAGTALIYVGRLVPDKGVIHLIEAMRLCPAATLTILGDGPERMRLQEAARDLTNVRFVGACPPHEVRAQMDAAGILVLPSLRNEGKPNVVLEAMAAGLAVIASRNAGIPALIRDGETGLLVEPGDVASLAAAITRLREDSALRAAIRQQARREIETYAWPNVIAKLEHELTTLVTAGAAPRAGEVQ